MSNDAPTDAHPAWTRNAVLIYGPRKAGTTLLVNLLDGSADLLAYPAEIKLKRLGRLRPPFRRQEYEPERRLDLATLPDEVRDRIRTRWRALAPNTVGSLDEFLRIDALVAHEVGTGAESSPAMWCAKEVGGDTEAILALWLQMFPSAKFVFIVRDPRMVARAVVRDRSRQEKRLSWRKLAYEISDPLRVVATLARHLGVPHAHFVVYEDLVAQPERTMRRLAAFLELPYDPNFAAPTVFGTPVVVTTSSRPIAAVFRSDAHWSDDLTWRERVIIGTVYRWRSLRLGFSYERLRRSIEARQGDTP